MGLFKRKKKTAEDSKKKDLKDKKVPSESQERPEEEKEKEKKEKEKSGKSMKDLYKSSTGERKEKKEEKKSSAPEDKKDERKEKEEEKDFVSGYSRAHKILVRPLVTEKISDLGTQNKYAFEVSLEANKIEVSKAIKGVYGVKPEKVNIIKMKGKRVRVGLVRGKRKDWKKAVITLPKGKTINVYESI